MEPATTSDMISAQNSSVRSTNVSITYQPVRQQQHSHRHQNFVHRCIIYPTGVGSPRYVLLPEADADWGTSPFVWIHADPSVWFPHGHRVRKVKRLPGTNFELEHTYQIYFSRDEISSITNHCVARRFDQHWLGDIIVVKRGRADPFQVLEMTRSSGEMELVDIIVSAWLLQVAHKRLYSNNL